MARPIEYDPEVIAVELLEYIDNSEDPYVSEYCIQRPISRDTVYRLEKDCKKLSDTIKYCHEKQKLRTVRGAESGDINSTFAIFKMKQKCYGWTDKTEVENTNTNIDLTETMTEEEKTAELQRLIEKRAKS